MGDASARRIVFDSAQGMFYVAQRTRKKSLKIAREVLAQKWAFVDAEF
jgi:hypothetical protein